MTSGKHDKLQEDITQVSRIFSFYLEKEVCKVKSRYELLRRLRDDWRVDFFFTELLNLLRDLLRCYENGMLGLSKFISLSVLTWNLFIDAQRLLSKCKIIKFCESDLLLITIGTARVLCIFILVYFWVFCIFNFLIYDSNLVACRSWRIKHSNASEERNLLIKLSRLTTATIFFTLFSTSITMFCPS